MDFLKSAVASAISKGPPFPYTFGDRVDVDASIWTLHNGTKREDGSNCSIFSFDVNDSSRLVLAKNAVRRLRTLRHPGVVKVLDSVETDSYIYIATERITPLSWHVRRDALNTETIKWGLYSTAITLRFLNEDAASIHGNVRVSSIFTSESGEWKLAGFEVFTSVKEDEQVIYKYGSLLPDSGRYMAPEVSKGGWEALKNQATPRAIDSWNFGILIYDVFNNGAFSHSDQLSQPKKVPQNMVMAYKRLIAANPNTRPSIANFLEQGKRSRGFFDTPLIHVAEFVENMGVKDQAEREVFLRELEETGDQFPEDFFKMKILPELLKSVEYGGGGQKVFSMVLRIGEKLSDEEWETTITPCVVRLFAVPDRATRVFLLDNLPKMIEHISPKIVNDKIFPEMMTGFSDVAPIIREKSVKAVLTIVPKLTDRTINGDLLKYLAKTQNDEQPGIRTNTTICLGKIAKDLGPNTRNKVLTAAFTRSLRDPFVHARNAALMALTATVDVFDETDCAVRLVPAITPSLIDKEKLIRTQAQKTLGVYLERIKTLTSSYPDTILPPTNSTESVLAPRMGTPQTAETAGGWAGWAISSFTNKLSNVTGEIQRSKSPAPPTPTPGLSVPPTTTTTTIMGPPSSTAYRKPIISPSPIPPKPINTFLGDEDNEDNDPDAWGDLEEESFFDAPKIQPSAVVKKPQYSSFNNNDEEDSDEVIMSALQTKPKNPLPKGLSKKPAPTFTTTTSARENKNQILNGKSNTTTTSRPTATAASKTTTTVVKPKPKPKPVVQKKEEETMWNDGEEDAWGNDDWGGI